MHGLLISLITLFSLSIFSVDCYTRYVKPRPTRRPATTVKPDCRPCNEGVKDEKEAWSLDTGIVPESLRGNSRKYDDKTDDRPSWITKREISRRPPSRQKPTCKPCEVVPEKKPPAWSLDTGIVPESLRGVRKHGRHLSESQEDNLWKVKRDTSQKPTLKRTPSLRKRQTTDTRGAEDDFSWVQGWEGTNTGTEVTDTGTEVTNTGIGVTETTTQRPEKAGREEEWFSKPLLTDADQYGTTASPRDVEETTASPDCTCVSLLKCGGSFKSSGNVDYDDGPSCLVEGEICCPNSAITLSSSLKCGEAKPRPGMQKSHEEFMLSVKLSEFGELPWTIYLYSTTPNLEENGVNDYKCTGALVHPRIVLTAAHCIINIDLSSVMVRAGEWDLQAANKNDLHHQDRRIERTRIHPNYIEGVPPYDMAIVVVASPFILSDHINTICFPDIESDGKDFDPNNCMVSGWGRDPKGFQTNVMKKMTPKIIPRNECQEKFRTTKRLGKWFKLDRTFTCALPEAGQDFCTGDGGAPLVCRSRNSPAWALAGVQAWGIDCGRDRLPSAYSDVVYMLPWIYDELEKIPGVSIR